MVTHECEEVACVGEGEEETESCTPLSNSHTRPINQRDQILLPIKFCVAVVSCVLWWSGQLTEKVLLGLGVGGDGLCGDLD